MKSQKNDPHSLQSGRVAAFIIFLFVSACVIPSAAAGPGPACGESFAVHTQVSVTETGRYFATGDPVSGRVGLFDNDGSPVWVVQTGENITCITVSDDGNTVAASSDDGRVFGFDKNGDLIWRHDDMGCHPVVMVSGDGDGWYIFNSDKTPITTPYTIHRLGRNGTILWETRVPGISGASVSRDGESAVIGSSVGRNSEVRMYAGNGMRIWDYPAPDGIGPVSVSADGKTIAAVNTYRLALLNGTGELLSEVIPKYRPVSLAVSYDGGITVTGSRYMVQAFDRNGTVLWQEDEDGIYCVAISRDGRNIFYRIAE